MRKILPDSVPFEIVLTLLEVAKALDIFDLDRDRWPEQAADRVAWRAMLRAGVAPAAFRAPPPAPVPPPINSYWVRPRRAAAIATNAAISSSLDALCNTTRDGDDKRLAD